MTNFFRSKNNNYDLIFIPIVGSFSVEMINKKHIKNFVERLKIKFKFLGLVEECNFCLQKVRKMD